MYDGKTQFLIKNLLNRYDNLKTEAPSILPPDEGTWKPPGIVKAN
jgi:hypothetical protein